MAQTITTKYLKTPFGELILGSYKNQLCLCDWRYRKMRTAIDQRIQKGLDANFEMGENEILSQTIEQLEAYSLGELKNFDIPLHFVGTNFQKKVWGALCEIPYGHTQSYLALSESLGDVKAIRAVATANGANAISILVPCHRIIGSDGKLVGYAGGLPTKKKLLDLEGALKKQQLTLF